MIQLKIIIDVVCNYTDVTKEEMFSKSRKREFTEAKHFCYVFARKFTNLSYSRIGKYFNTKDHSTVMHGLNTMNNLIYTSRETKQLYEIMKNEIQTKLNNLVNFEKHENVYIVTKDTIDLAYKGAPLPDTVKMINKSQYNETINILIQSCEEGMDGRWDCGTAEGKESFQPMIDDLETLIIR